MAAIDSFRAALMRRGGAFRQHRWRITINFPTFAASAELGRDVNLLALTTNTPISRVGELPIIWGGVPIPLPGDREFDLIPITFMATEGHAEHDAFEIWQENVTGSITNNRSQELNDLLVDVQMDLLDSGDNVTKSYVLQGAYPQEVGQLDLDQSAQNSYGQFTVNMRFLNAVNANSL